MAKKLRALTGDQETDSAAEEEEEEIPGDVALSTGDWDKAAKVAAERPGVPGRIEDVLQRLFAASRPVSPPPPPPPVFVAQRAGPSGTRRPDPKAKRALIYSSDEDDVDDDVPVRRRRKRARNPFVLDEAAEADDEECSLDGEYDDAYADPFYF